MTAAEQRFFESVPARLKGMEKHLAKISELLTELIDYLRRDDNEQSINDDTL